MFFSRKNDVTVTDIVWMSQTAKWQGIMEEWKKDNHLSVICWFDTTFHFAESLLIRQGGAGSSVFLASQMHPALLTGGKLIFAEHYPLQSKEMKLFEKLLLKEVTVYSALDEPLFSHFGGERIIRMMKQMGSKGNQGIQHKLISSSISKAQVKIERKVSNELLCNSPEEWMEKNLIS